MWGTNEFKQNGVDNYDLIGLSYYPVFSPNTAIEDIGVLVRNLSNTSGKEVMIVETGFAWSENIVTDNYTNFINNNGEVLPYATSVVLKVPIGICLHLIDILQRQEHF